jgi:hypothetical protein
MTSLARRYLSDVARHLHLAPTDQDDILTEIRDHIEDSARELMDEGLPSDAAISQAIDGLGRPQSLAEQMYSVHTQGSWYHTALAVLPHICLSVLFAFGLWATPGWLVILLGASLVISALGWKKGRPNWTHPWLGYTLIATIVSWGLAMSAVGYGAWGVITEGTLPLGSGIYLASFVYIAISLWVVIRILSKVAQHDWVMASVTVLPIPFLVYWFVFFYQEQLLLASQTGSPVQGVETSAAIVFLILAAATALFFRISRRVVRVGLLMITVPSTFVLAWLSYQRGPGYMALFVVSAVALAVVLAPALYDLRAKGAATEDPVLAKDVRQA